MFVLRKSANESSWVDWRQAGRHPHLDTPGSTPHGVAVARRSRRSHEVETSLTESGFEDREGLSPRGPAVASGAGGVPRAGAPEMRPTPLPRSPVSAAPSRPPVVAPAPAPAPRSGVPTGAWRQEANRWVGTPYRYGGMDRRGVDCSGFACEMYRRVAGVLLPRTAASSITLIRRENA